MEIYSKKSIKIYIYNVKNKTFVCLNVLEQLQKVLFSISLQMAFFKILFDLQPTVTSGKSFKDNGSIITVPLLALINV